jgi:hypothetical protein
MLADEPVCALMVCGIVTTVPLKHKEMWITKLRWCSHMLRC